ncbi:MAG TPA: sulfite exporter TauE/SafE family protein [Methylomirabilota bacterium]|nr:sulfite exporter TauE/SafE family protein [Methylomirabilota bacterium]
MISSEAMLVAGLAVFAGYLIFGVTGFGASPITIPILVHVLPLTFVLPLATLLDFAAALVLGIRTRQQADTRELLVLVPFTALGLILGVTLLVNLPRDITLQALGLFVCAYAVRLMLRRERTRRLTRWWAAPAGITGGVVGALFGMGGPPYVAYIAGRVSDPAAQRATISHMVIVNVGLRVAAFAVAGFLLSRALWIAVATLLPIAWAGVWVGHHLHVRVAPPTVARAISAVLFASGVVLIFRTL